MVEQQQINLLNLFTLIILTSSILIAIAMFIFYLEEGNVCKNAGFGKVIDKDNFVFAEKIECENKELMSKGLHIEHDKWGRQITKSMWIHAGKLK